MRRKVILLSALVAAPIIAILVSIIIVSSESATSDAKALVARAISKLEPNANWKSVEVDENSSQYFYSANIIYKPDYDDTVDPGEPARDSADLAAKIIAELSQNGQKPIDQSVGINVMTWKPAGVGESGQRLIYIFGSSVYSPIHDSVEWKPHKIPD